MTRLSPRPIPSRPEQSESAFIPPRPVWRADLEHLILSSPPPTRSPARGQTRGHDERHDAHSLGSGQSTRRSAPSTPAPAPQRLAARPGGPPPRRFLERPNASGRGGARAAAHLLTPPPAPARAPATCPSLAPSPPLERPSRVAACRLLPARR